ncbi:hypothetical protein ACHAPU_003220 [Fusarium lateritium]
MAEVAGIVLGIAGLKSFGKPTLEIAKALRSFAKHEDPIADAIRGIANRIELSATTVDIAVQQLKGHCSTLQNIKDKPSGILQYLSETKSLDTLVRGTLGIEKQLKDATQSLKTTKGRHAFWRRVKWYVWNKIELDDLFPSMQSLLLCLNFICPLLKFEISNYMMENSNAEGMKCMKEEM